MEQAHDAARAKGGEVATGLFSQLGGMSAHTAGALEGAGDLGAEIEASDEAAGVPSYVASLTNPYQLKFICGHRDLNPSRAQRGPEG